MRHNCQTEGMITVIIPTLNSEATLTKCLAALIPAAVDGIVTQVVIADGGSKDATRKIADSAGTDIVVTEPGRGQQIRAGIAEARAPWLLVLHSDTYLAHGWIDEVANFIEAVDIGRHRLSAAAFQFALDDMGVRPRLLEQMVHLRCSLAKLPYGDQGLLIPKRLHDKLGGFKPLPLLEDLDMVRRLGRNQIKMLNAKALTDPTRYSNEGYLRRIMRNQICLAMYMAGQPVEKIAAYYNKPQSSIQDCDPVQSVADQKPISDINPS